MVSDNTRVPEGLPKPPGEVMGLSGLRGERGQQLGAGTRPPRGVGIGLGEGGAAPLSLSLSLSFLLLLVGLGKGEPTPTWSRIPPPP